MVPLSRTPLSDGIIRINQRASRKRTRDARGGQAAPGPVADPQMAGAARGLRTAIRSADVGFSPFRPGGSTLADVLAGIFQSLADRSARRHALCHALEPIR